MTTPLSQKRALRRRRWQVFRSTTTQNSVDASSRAVCSLAICQQHRLQFGVTNDSAAAGAANCAHWNEEMQLRSRGSNLTLRGTRRAVSRFRIRTRARARVGVLAGSLTTGILVQGPTAERVCRNLRLLVLLRESVRNYAQMLPLCTT